MEEDRSSIDSIDNGMGSAIHVYISYASNGGSGGLSMLKCAVFIVAQTAGSGLLALPYALSETGWTGVGIMSLVCVLGLYCGVILGKCWLIVLINHQPQGHVRDPYPLIGYYGLGKPGKYVAEFSIMFTLIGSSVVYLLLAANQISILAKTNFGFCANKEEEFRLWILICGVALIPLVWLASPKEMWYIAYIVSGCTIVACVLIVIRTSMYIHSNGLAPKSNYKEVNLESFFKAFGTIQFAFAGALIFPTLQTDMKQPKNFVYAAGLGFFGVYTLYIPVSILPYIGFGNFSDPNIIVTLTKLSDHNKIGYDMVYASNILFTIHLIFAIIIISNPVSQQIEEYFKIEHRFDWQRIVIRSSLMLLVIGMGELFQNFDSILSLIGATTVNMMCFIMPCILYQKLHRDVPLHQKVLHYEIIFIALLCGVFGMYSAIKSIRNPLKSIY